MATWPKLTRRGLLAGATGVAVVGATRTTESSEVEPEVEWVRYAAGCGGGVTKLRMPRTRKLNVLLTGDAGSGTAVQYAVATAAAKLSKRVPLHLAVGLGDNIYEMGATGDCGADFLDKFERPNRRLRVPWLMVQGNHDNTRLIPGDGGDLARGDHEVAYHRYSARWFMPRRYYRVTLPRGARRPLVEFIALDDNPLTSYLPQLDPRYAVDGPFMTAQRAFVDRRLRRSRAVWKFVLSHHPYANNGDHGSAGGYDDLPVDPARGTAWKELVEHTIRGRADFLLAGHDHSLQILDLPRRPGDRVRTRQIVCGAAGKSNSNSDADAWPPLWQAYGKPGFMVLKLRDHRLTIDAYVVDVATKTARRAHRHVQKR